MAKLSNTWVNFFLQAGIPANESASYALIFAENRIQENMLLDLNKEYLKDMGITLLGDVIAILKHAKVAHEKKTRAPLLKQKAATGKEPVANKPVKTVAKGQTSNPKPLASEALLEKFKVKYSEAKTRPLQKESSSQNLTAAPATVIPKQEFKVSKKPVNAQHVAAKKELVSKKTIFDRLGDGSVSSTTPESTKDSSIFARLGNSDVSSSTSSAKEAQNLKIVVDSNKGTTVTKTLGNKKEEAKVVELPMKKASFLESRSLENLTIVADFDDEDEPKKPGISLSSRFKTLQTGPTNVTIKTEEETKVKVPLKRKNITFNDETTGNMQPKKVRFSDEDLNTPLVSKVNNSPTKTPIKLTTTSPSRPSMGQTTTIKGVSSSVKSRIGTPAAVRRPIKERIAFGRNSVDKKSNVRDRLG